MTDLSQDFLWLRPSVGLSGNSPKALATALSLLLPEWSTCLWMNNAFSSSADAILYKKLIQSGFGGPNLLHLLVEHCHPY